MPTNLNRALQVRTADRLRASLARDEASGLPLIDALSDADEQELCEVGGGRVAAVAIRIAPSGPGDVQEPVARSRTGMLREVARLVHQHVRRSDLLGSLDPDTLVVLAPGLDSTGGRHLVHRLRELLGTRVHVEIGARHVYASRCSQKPHFGDFR
jgi:hypothetical protein